MKIMTTAAVALTCALAAHQANAAKVCINTVTGAIAARSKCKANETTASAANFMDALKGHNSYLSSCRLVEASDGTTNGTAAARVSCKPSEFLLNYGDYTTPIALSAVRMNKIEYRGGIPSGVYVLAQTEVYAPDSPLFDTWTLTVTGTCCPSL